MAPAASGPAEVTLHASVTAPAPEPVSSTAPPPTPPLPWWRQDRYIALLFLAVLMLVYSRAWNGAFVWDDDSYISKNPAMRSAQGLWQIWFQPWAAGHQFYPLSFSVFWLGFHFWGLHTLGYHLVSIFFHATASVLLWQILKRAAGPRRAARRGRSSHCTR